MLEEGSQPITKFLVAVLLDQVVTHGSKRFLAGLIVFENRPPPPPPKLASLSSESIDVESTSALNIFRHTFNKQRT